MYSECDLQMIHIILRFWTNGQYGHHLAVFVQHLTCFCPPRVRSWKLEYYLLLILVTFWRQFQDSDLFVSKSDFLLQYWTNSKSKRIQYSKLFYLIQNRQYSISPVVQHVMSSIGYSGCCLFVCNTKQDRVLHGDRSHIALYLLPAEGWRATATGHFSYPSPWQRHMSDIRAALPLH